MLSDDWRKFFIAKLDACSKVSPKTKYYCPDVPKVTMVRFPVVQDCRNRFPLACRWDTAARRGNG